MIRQFVDRVDELSTLNKWHSSNLFEMIVIYGRRRIGKTFLLKRFLEESKGFYFLCDMSGTKSNLNRLKSEFARFIGEPMIASDSIDEIFEYIVSKTDKRTVVVMDEFSYLLEKDPGFASIFQRIVDEVLAESSLMLVLCGSSISMMEEGILNGRSPLYGRKTGHIRLDPIPFSFVSDFFPSYSVEDLVEIHSAFGAVPYHLSLCDDGSTVLENINNNLLERSGRLFDEVGFLLRQELREIDVYKHILSTISSGSTRVSHISDRTSIPSNTLTKYLQRLLSLGFIRKEYSITDRKMARPLYSVNDNLMDMWFRFCEPYKSDLETGETGPVINGLRKNFQTYVGRKFEDLIRKQFFRRIPSFDPVKVGRYWHGGVEIDTVAVDSIDSKAAFCEVKWSRVDGKKVLNDLRRKVDEIQWSFDDTEFYVIARELKDPCENCIEFRSMVGTGK